MEPAPAAVPSPAVLSEADDRRNGKLYLWATLLSYLAAPVFYVGITQAALCHKLGASAALSNLPATVNYLGCAAPIVFACLIPLRLERAMVVASNALMIGLMAVIGCVLVLPLSPRVQIGAVVGQCLLLGILNAISQLFLLQCLRRGTTEKGRARALKIAFTFGPMAAVAGSLLAQFVLRGGIPGLAFPKDFAVLHFFAVPCAAVTAWCCRGFVLPPVVEPPRLSFLAQMGSSFRHFLTSRTLAFLWLGYLFWYCTLFAMPNLSLFTRQAMGRDPAEFSGIILAIRFGSKALAGYLLGVLNLRYGVRAPMIATVALLGCGMLWASLAPGYFYLIAFGFMGAGELGGTYFPNAILSWSSGPDSTRDLALLTLAIPLACPFPAVHGLLTDHWGFHASFGLAIVTALIALFLVFRLPAGSNRRSS